MRLCSKAIPVHSLVLIPAQCSLLLSALQNILLELVLVLVLVLLMLAAWLLAWSCLHAQLT